MQLLTRWTLKAIRVYNGFYLSHEAICGGYANVHFCKCKTVAWEHGLFLDLPLFYQNRDQIESLVILVIVKKMASFALQTL